MNVGFFILPETLFLINEKPAIQTSKKRGFALNGRHFVKNQLFEKTFVYLLNSTIY